MTDDFQSFGRIIKAAILRRLRHPERNEAGGIYDFRFMTYDFQNLGGLTAALILRNKVSRSEGFSPFRKIITH